MPTRSPKPARSSPSESFPMAAFNAGLGALPLLSSAKSRSISAENPDGAKGGGAREAPPGASHPAWRLGKGWKVRPFVSLKQGDTTVLADIAGPGIINHIWMTVEAAAYRDCVLRFYWDGERTPSVECPLGDFFASVHGLRYNVNSLPVSVNPQGGFNCYWQMPFRRRARITIENQHWKEIRAFFYQVDYSLAEVPDSAAYFHAQWRRSITTRQYPEHVILDGVRGRGQYVGTVLAWTQLSDGWWGEGEVKFFIDGDSDYPTICGTGTEDYFGGAWCFTDTFSGPFLGYPLWTRDEGDVPKHGLYRWHVLDPVRFGGDLRVTVQALGWYGDGTFQPLTDDIASTAFWYQAEPHAPFPEMPDAEGRWPRIKREWAGSVTPTRPYQGGQSRYGL